MLLKGYVVVVCDGLDTRYVCIVKEIRAELEREEGGLIGGTVSLGFVDGGLCRLGSK